MINWNVRRSHYGTIPDHSIKNWIYYNCTINAFSIILITYQK